MHLRLHARALLQASRLRSIPLLLLTHPKGRGSTNQDLTCNQRCVNLEQQAPLLFPRARNYYLFWVQNGSKTLLLPSSSWPVYLMGHCGSNATDLSSELGVVRHVGLYGFPLSAQSQGLCGNYMLNANEECDDGNTVDGDGCTSACMVQRNGYWDCDVLGELCQTQCGWRAADLSGFVLPQAINPNIPWCTGLTYMDFLQVPASGRSLWMQSMLVSCTCFSNPHQQLPYAQCNYSNAGPPPSP